MHGKSKAALMTVTSMEGGLIVSDRGMICVVHR